MSRRAQHRLRVDVEDGGEVLRRGALSRLRHPSIALSTAGCNLLVEIDRLIAVDLDGDHDAIHSSVITTRARA